jgi:hypothetical protein
MELSRKGILTPLQSDTLRSFFGQTQGFFLTGGTALAEFYLGHRDSEDLDLFTVDKACFESGHDLLVFTASQTASTLNSLRVTPYFQRYEIVREDQKVLVDLVHDTAPQIVKDKPDFQGLRVDSIEDITANKLCTVLSRLELKDYVDLYFLAKAGISVDDALPNALRKDGGISKTMLAYLMAELRVPAVPSTLRAPLTAGELQAFFHDLSERWAKDSAPPQSNNP